MKRDNHSHRLAYKSRSKAVQKARKLGLMDVHSHQHNGKTMYMPGANHQELNDRLTAMGKKPVSVPGKGSGMMGMGIGMEEDTFDPADDVPDMAVNEDVPDMDADMPDMEMDIIDPMAEESSHNGDDDDDSGGLYG